MIENIDTACAFYGLTSIILPFTTATHTPATIPEDALEILKMSKPQLLVLPAGLALGDLKDVQCIKFVIVVDISTGPHIDWSDEGHGIPVKTWQQVLETSTLHEPCEPAPVAIQSFVSTQNGFKSIEFNQEVNLCLGGSHLRTLSLQLQVK